MLVKMLETCIGSNGFEPKEYKKGEVYSVLKKELTEALAVNFVNGKKAEFVEASEYKKSVPENKAMQEGDLDNKAGVQDDENTSAQGDQQDDDTDKDNNAGGIVLQDEEGNPIDLETLGYDQLKEIADANDIKLGNLKNEDKIRKIIANAVK